MIKKQEQMKTSVMFLLMAFACLTAGSAWGQTLDEADAHYHRFNQMRMEGADDAALYDMLYLCFQDYAAIAEDAPASSSECVAAKRALREICPFLQSGAAYYSSRGNARKALLFAQAYMDIPLMESFQGETFSYSAAYPTMAYFAASGTYNSGNYAKAIDYFKAYLASGDARYRQTVYTYMAKACIETGDYDLAMQTLEEAADAYPSDFNILSMAINSCIDREDETNLQKFLDRALALRPGDETLLNIQGRLYENTYQFSRALDVYGQLRQANPSNLEIAQHIALNTYNIGVLDYNKASISASDAERNRYMNLAKGKFREAARVLEAVVGTVPSAARYLQALATAYSCIGDEERLAATNSKLASIGGQEVPADAVPAMVAFSERSSGGNAYAAAAGKAYAGTVAESALSSGDGLPAGNGTDVETPLYSQYAKEYVERRIREWQAKDPYETVAEYQERVTEESRAAKVDELLKDAESTYIDTYAKNIRFDNLTLKPYDADNGAFLVESPFGELIVPVPRENNEAKVFESSWSSMRFTDPQYFIANDRLMLSGLTFVTPLGNRYRYDASKDLRYAETVVDIAFDPIEVAVPVSGRKGEASIGRQEITMGVAKSDVDVDIPQSETINENTYALIIANENYSMVSKVPFALNDGQVFAEYCTKTLGLPKRNVLLFKDASYGIMLNAMDRIKRIANAYEGDIDILFYYAGHGIPDESSRDAFLLPVDADGKQTKVCYPVSELYAELGRLDARSVTVFLDACFSGAKRDGGMVAEARGVAIKPKVAAPQGNTVVFSAVSDDETALPYEEKGHGLFTYYLLKKLKETKGKVRLQELSEYVARNVSRDAEIVNNKSQTPTVAVSETYSGNWQEKVL